MSNSDLDPQETREWLDALSGVIETEGRARAHDLLENLLDHARQAASTCRSRRPRRM
jgi:pyruvate dehydrogenase E1 component